MPTISELKEQAVTETPLLLFDCALPDGRTERWSTHRAVVEGATYQPRVLRHNVFEMQASSEQGADGIPRISIVLANADSYFSEIERSAGMKGARLTVGFLFYDLRNQTAASERAALFQGICNPPDEIREATFRITATNRMNLQRALLPQVRIQRRCPWEFPASEAPRIEAIDGGSHGKYSRYYRCGYSAGLEGGNGALDGDAPFTTCGYTRQECQARGMFSHFGGIEFVPPAISVRTAGDKDWHTSAIAVNTARYNDFVPMVYGTAWYAPPVVFARNDGNLTRLEALLGIGEMAGVLKVLVNDVEIPLGVNGANMTGTGWYNVPTLGTRAGACNGDFLTGDGQPAGDPYGSMAYISVVVPNRLNDGSSLPRVRVLAQGLKVPKYASDGSFLGEQYSNNPVWVLLDVLRRTGWTASEIDIPSFAEAAALCDETVESVTLYGQPISLPRFQCNLALQSRKSAGDVVRGLRACARLLLTYGTNGVLRARMENSISREQREKPEWSNSTEPLNGGWPSYEFGDGSSGFGGILRKATGESSVRLYSRGMADTPNRFAVEFQDALNEYQQDSLSVMDPDDVAKSGQEISASVSALGLANYDQAARILRLYLDKSVRGNLYIEFETSIKSFGVRPGDLITVTYLKEGLLRQAFRVLKVAPGVNHRVSTITAQIHEDAWYDDANGRGAGASGRRQGDAGLGIPRPLLGGVVDENGDIQFGVEESELDGSDGSVETNVRVRFTPPAAYGASGPPIPLVDLTATLEPGGNLESGQIFYYGVSAVDATGCEGRLSFLVRVIVMADGSSASLTGLDFAPGTAGFNVYRGASPASLFRIASNQPLASEFIDPGLPKELVAPPDANFDHANFYWRRELQPETAAATHSMNTIGNSALQMPENGYRGETVRIVRGRGAGQERAVASNTGTELTVAPAWGVEPDATSVFAIAESGWRFGAQSKSGQAQFTIPNRTAEVVHISGLAANVNDAECSPEISIVTRWTIGGSGTPDSQTPPKPVFAVNPGKRGGTAEIIGVGFEDLTNTKSITAATAVLHYWDELQGGPTAALASATGQDNQALEFTGAEAIEPGSLVQIEREIVRVEAVSATGYAVTRGVLGSEADAHPAQTPVYALRRKTVIAPFPAEFFGSPCSGGWSHPVILPDARIAAAELFVTNRKGNSETASACMTHTEERGLRTLSGGQYSIQVNGCLAVDQEAAPALVVESSHAVLDVFGVLGAAADAPVRVELKVDGEPYCAITFPAGISVSDSVSGTNLPPLRVGTKLTVSVTSVGTTYPGADLTVVVRL